MRFARQKIAAYFLLNNPSHNNMSAATFRKVAIGYTLWSYGGGIHVMTTIMSSEPHVVKHRHAEDFGWTNALGVFAVSPIAVPWFIGKLVLDDMPMSAVRVAAYGCLYGGGSFLCCKGVAHVILMRRFIP